MAWLRDVRVIGENPDSSSPVKVFVSGLATEDDCGIFGVEPGDDPNFPEDNDGSITVFSWEVGMALPYHQACYRLLCKAEGVNELHKQAYYETLKGLCSPKNFKSSLNIDYGSVGNLHDQYWIVTRDTTYVMLSPVDIPQLADYYKHLPALEAESKTLDRAPKQPGTDPFYSLAPESRHLVLDHLDMPTVSRLQAASSAVHALELGPAFWRRQLETDMPWLYDLPQLSSDERDKVDWVRVYKDLHLASKLGNEHTILGLVNRRRIWETTIPQIIKPYREITDEKAAEKESTPQVFEDATSTSAARLAMPGTKDIRTTTFSFVREFWDLSSAHPVLLVDWTEGGRVVGLSVYEDGSSGEPSRPGASSSELHRTDRIPFPDDDWMTGLVITGQEIDQTEEGESQVWSTVGLEVLFAKQDPVPLGVLDGDKFLVHASDQHFLVGLETGCSPSGRLSRVSFLQQPCDKVYMVDRVVARRQDRPNPHAMGQIWHKELPPDGVRFSPPKAGYWSRSKSLVPLQPLVFGPSEEELADITSLSADVQFGGVVVTYGNRVSRSIGYPIRAATTLKIDGRGGERIVAMDVKVAHIPCLLRFVTNRGRQLVVGHAGGAARRFPAALETDAPSALAGVYGCWKGQTPAQTTLMAVGCLFVTGAAYATPDGVPPVPSDSKGFSWDLDPPPSSFTEDGREWGAHNRKEMFGQRTIPVPDEGSMVRWLDCRRPVARVRATLCHSTREAQVPLVSISLVYADADGGRMTAGPEDFPQLPELERQDDGKAPCWCPLGAKRAEELEAFPHFQHNSWEVGGKRLGSLRVWLSEQDALIGLQFTAEDATEGPVWTREADGLGGPSGEIVFSAAGGEAAGLKLYFDENGRQVTRDDSIVVAIQALKET